MAKQKPREVTPAEILVVDDTPANLKLLTDILTERGYRVRPAGDARLALRSVKFRLPDLILLDVRMPDIDGYEVCRALKSDEKSRDVPVIFISALHETTDKVRGFEAGGLDFITKPFQSEEVLVRIETHLALRRLREELRVRNIQLQQEIAERRQVEEALRRSESTYRTILENTGTALLIVEEDTVISYANTWCERLSGYSREEMEGKMSWTAFVAHEDLARVKRNHVLRRIDPEAVPASYELRLVDRQGNIKNVVANVAMIPETGKSVGSLMDVSELRKMEAELHRARKWESIGIFSGGIAHDFNNLLGIVLGNISLAEMQMSNPEPGVQEYLKKAERACLQSRDLTKRLIDLTGGAGPVGSPQSIRRVIADAVTVALRGSDVQCKLDLAEDLWPVACDVAQIDEMMVNLVVNAWEAMEQGGVIDVSAGNEHLASGSIPTLKAGKYIHVVVEDHGKGIPEEILPGVFDPYFSTKQRGAKKGMGLGLTMAYAIAKGHYGDIRIESKAGVGTTLHVYLPVSEESAREQPR